MDKHVDFITARNENKDFAKEKRKRKIHKIEIKTYKAYIPSGYN